MIFSVGFTSFAAENEEYYAEYDDYSEFEEDYYNTVGIPDQPPQEEFHWYNGLSPIPVVIGIVAGALTVIILLRKQSIAMRHMPEPTAYSYAPDIKHTLKGNTDND